MLRWAFVRDRPATGEPSPPASGDIIEDPVFGYRLRLSHDGEVLRGEFWVEPGGGGKIEHLHPTIEERFEVLEGELKYRAAGSEHSARAGERFTISPGTPHSFRNSGHSTAHLVVGMEPALQMAELFKDAAALARAGKWTAIGRHGVPTGPRAVLDMSEFLDRYRQIFIATSPPQALQRIAVPRLARLARRLPARMT